jgi:hypothetical protein
MTLIIEKPTGAKLLLSNTYDGLVSDSDANAYLAAVQAADGQLLEPGVRIAVNNFVVGCKADSIWDSLDMCLILCGARTINGALVPLKGPSPTNVNLTANEYSRALGLNGNSANFAYLNTNYSLSLNAQDNCHCSVFLTSRPNFTTFLDGGGGGSGATTLSSGSGSTAYNFRSRSNLGNNATGDAVPCFVGITRAGNLEFTARMGATETLLTRTSSPSLNRSLWLFATSTSSTPSGYSNSQVSFVSAGASLNLLTLKGRVDTLISAIGAAF